MADLYYANQFFTTQLSVSGGLDNSQTTGIVLQAVSGIDDTSKPGIALINYADPLDTDIAEWVKYTSINSTTKTLVGVTRGEEGFSAKAHSNGVTVAFPVSKAHINNINDKLTGNDTGVTLDDPAITGTPTFDSEAQEVVFYNSMARQAIINGNFDVWQRGTSFTTSANNDDVYTADRWNLISDGNDVLDVSQEAITDLPGSNYAIKLDVETSARAGIVQFLEAKDAQKFQGKTVSVSFAVKSANISAIRAAVLSWDSTADAVTSDVVGTWGATPTWATNWTQENTPADLTVTSSWTTVKVENISVDTASMNNLALAIWIPSAETIGDIIYISQVQMCMGSVALPFKPKTFAQELADCQRYYEKSYDYATALGSTSEDGSTRFLLGTDSTGFLATTTEFAVEKRTTPTIVTYDMAGASSKISTVASSTARTNNVTPTAVTDGTKAFYVQFNATGGARAGLQYHWTASAEL